MNRKKMIAWLTIVFLSCIVASCQKTPSSPRSVMRLSLDLEPEALDPRLARSLNDVNVLRLLFEGLTCPGKNGKATLSLAKQVKVSEDGLCYTFELHPAKWSNGDPVTAFDFEWAWKSILDPNFATDIAYQLYPIKNGKNCKMGLVGKEELGVRAKDSSTLVVELEQPLPYFLELVSMSAFFPVHIPSAMKNRDWHLSAQSFVSNGPFCLKIWNHSDRVVLKKNPFFRDQKSVRLEGVECLVLSADTSLRMYEQGDLDWVGSPFSRLPPDAIGGLQNEKKLRQSEFAGTFFYRINTNPLVLGKKNPLSDPRFRKALSLALDRGLVVDHVLQGGQSPALSLVPSHLATLENRNLKKQSLADAQTEARRLLSEVETGEDPIIINYQNDELRQSIALVVQSQWESVLGIKVILEAIEPKIYHKKISQEEYQIAAGSWMADFYDPINFLEVFKYRHGGTNQTGWENEDYIDLLNRSAVCEDYNGRNMLLHSAEMILMEELPIIPIYHYALNYLRTEGLKDVVLSPMGQMDLREAYFDFEEELY